MLLALIAVCAFIACTNPTDSNGGDTGGGNTPSVPEVQGYTVRFTAGEGGAITAKADGQNIVSGSKVKKDTLVTFTATPAGNAYVVGEWTIASPAVFKDGGEKGAMTAEVSVTGDVTIGVQFEQVTPLAPGQIRIMITGDGRTDLYKCYIDTEKNTTWGAIKTQIETKFTLLKTEWQGGDYGVYVWKLGSEKGTALTDGHPFTEGTTVYAVTNYIKFRMNGTVLEGYDGAEPRGRIIIPDTTTKIKKEAFKNCTALTGTLVFPRSLKEIEGAVFNGAFQNCTGLTGLDFSACTELTEIGYYAFDDCENLTGSLDLSPCTQLTKIGNVAFEGCSGFTGALKLPPNITEIGTYAFSGCSGFTGSLDLSAYTKLTKIGSSAFRNCSGFTGDLKLPPTLTELDSAFWNCSGLTGNLDLSACTKLTKIESVTFSGCKGLTGELKLPPNITEIGAAAFSGCKGFTGSLDLSAYTKLTKIGSDAFNDCSGFSGELKLPANITEIGSSAFFHCSGFTGALDLSTYTKLTKIGGSAFWNCSGFTGELKLPPTLTELDGAFWDCSGLTGGLDLSACTKLTKIKKFTFYGCKGLTGELKLPPNITEIGEAAFYNCSGLTGSLDLSSCTKLVEIEKDAFHDCSGFTGELKLPPTLTELDGGAFYNCSGLTGLIVFPQSLRKIKTFDMAGTFGECTGLTELDFSACTALTEIGSYAFSGCTQAEVKLSESVQTIGNRAFGSAADLDFDIADSYCKKVKIPSGAQYKRIKALVKQSPYPEERIEAY